MLRKAPIHAILEHIFFNFHNILLAASLQNSFFPKTICAAQRDAESRKSLISMQTNAVHIVKSFNMMHVMMIPIMAMFLFDYIVVQQKVKSVEQVKEKSCRVAHYFQQQGYKKGEVREEKREN